MSVLDKYRRFSPSYSGERRTLSVRIPKELYEQWAETCRRNGYSMSEGLRVLLEHDLHGEEREMIPRVCPVCKKLLQQGGGEGRP